MANVVSIASCLLILLHSLSIPFVTAVVSYAPQKCASTYGVYLFSVGITVKSDNLPQGVGRLKFLIGPSLFPIV